MSADVLPDEVKAFLLRYIDSVAQLEALLLLRANADLAWSADMLALRLYTSVQDTAELLARLCADGFLAAHDSEPPLYQYHCPHATKPTWSTKSPCSIPNISFRSRI